jgi:arylsulfatase B
VHNANIQLTWRTLPFPHTTSAVRVQITPHLDTMVKEGVELTNFYVFKYCAPTRGALMSGRYPFHFGFYNNQDANDYGIPTNFTLLPATLRTHGYRTHMLGKWHL